MNALERIKKDMDLFEKNLKEVELLKLASDQLKIVEMAKNYAADTIYYLEKKDYLTSFGCITYAHGLLDAVRLNEGLI
jgi:hypothetical protein